MKVRIVYNTKTLKIPYHIWNEDGTVSVLGKDDNLIVSMVESCYVDFENGNILLEEINGKEKERGNGFLRIN